MIDYTDYVGKWLSAALEDENVCDEMKEDIRKHFDQQQELIASGYMHYKESE